MIRILRPWLYPTQCKYIGLYLA